MVAGNDRTLQGAPQLAQLGLERAAVDELEQLEPLVSGNRQHRSERALNPGGGQQRRAAGAAGRLAEDPRERVAEPAVGLEPRVHAGVDRRRAAVERLHRRPEAAGALVGLEGHPEAALERPPDLDGIEPRRRRSWSFSFRSGCALISSSSGASQFGAAVPADIGSHSWQGR